MSASGLTDRVGHGWVDFGSLVIPGLSRSRMPLFHGFAYNINPNNKSMAALLIKAIRDNLCCCCCCSRCCFVVSNHTLSLPLTDTGKDSRLFITMCLDNCFYDCWTRLDARDSGLLCVLRSSGAGFRAGFVRSLLWCVAETSAIM